MKKLLFFGACIFLSSQVYGQTDVSVAFNQLYKASKNTLISAVGQVGNNTYVIKWDRNKYSMLIYDANLKLLKERDFKGKNCKNATCIDVHFSYIKTLFFENEILMFFITQDKKTKNKLLLCQAFGPEGEFIGDLKIIDTIESSKKISHFMIEHNHAKNKFVVVQDVDEKFLFKVYDANLNNLSNSAIELPYDDKNTSVVNYFLSNKGDVYMLLERYLKKNEKQKNGDFKSFSLLSLECSADNSLSEYKFQLPQKYVKSIDLQINDIDQTVSCAGLYGLKAGGLSNIDGMFFLNIHMETKKIISESYNPFDRSILHSFSVKNFTKLPDGSGYIIAENNYIEHKFHSKSSGLGSSIVFHSDDILVIKISAKGEMQTLTNIPKRQSNFTDEYQSFMTMQKDNKILLMYNDNPMNLTNDASTIKPFTVAKNGALALIEIFPDGKFSKVELFKNEDKKLAAEPRNGFMLKDGVYIVPTNGNSNTFGIIKFDVK